MTQTRTVIMLWVLAVLLMGGTATHIKLNATVGENVLLPCDCSETTYKVVWQEGKIVVNYFHSVKTDSAVADLYKNRSLLFLSSEKGNCTLLLLHVSFSDQRNFTCYTIDNDGFQQTEVSLIITERLQYTPTEPPPIDLPTPNTSEYRGDGEKEEQAKLPAGIPASLVALLLVAGAVIMVLVLRKRHQNIQEREVVEDLQAGVPMMKNCPV